MMNILKVEQLNIIQKKSGNQAFEISMPPMGSLNYTKRKSNINRINNDNIVTYTFTLVIQNILNRLKKVKPTYSHKFWNQHEKKINQYKYNIANTHFIDLRGYGLIGNKRYSKQIDGRSRRALTSQPGKRARNNRLTSSSPKFRGHSDKGNLEDNPYT